MGCSTFYHLAKMGVADAILLERNKLTGADVPAQACEHLFLRTKPVEGVTQHLPTFSDHDSHTYSRDESGGFLAGRFEPMDKALASGAGSESLCHLPLSISTRWKTLTRKLTSPRSVPGEASARSGARPNRQPVEGLNPMSKDKLTVAPNGERRKKGNHPALPVTIDALAVSGRACQKAGTHEILITTEGGDIFDVHTQISCLEAIRPAAASDLDLFLTELEGRDLSWAACAFGRHEAASLREAVRRGGIGRIEFKNNTEAPDGARLSLNAASVATFVQKAAQAGYEART